MFPFTFSNIRLKVDMEANILFVHILLASLAVKEMLLTLIAYFLIMFLNFIFMFFLKVLIWWSGLMRGVVSMAIAYNQVRG